MAAIKVTVFLTDHFIKRYNERVGQASPAGQRSWVAGSIKRNIPRRVRGDQHRVKLIGAPYVAILKKEGNGVWIAITVLSTDRNQKGA